MHFSIVIPTYNRDSDLKACLESIRTNSVGRHEVIVLHNMNNDTKAVCDRYGAVSIFDDARKNGRRVKTLWAILNQGIRAAHNDYVMYLNDDCLVMPGWDKIAEKYFSSDENIGLLILRAKGIGGVHTFRVIEEPFFFLPCANYGILNKKSDLFFDEKFSWYYGDGDLPLQFAAWSKYKVASTEENMVIHNHRRDESRNEHDAALLKNQKDKWHYFMKWAAYRRNGQRLQKQNPVCCFSMRLFYGVKIMFETPIKYLFIQKSKLQLSCTRHPWLRIVLSPLIIAYRSVRFVRAELKLASDRGEYKRQCGKNKLFAYHRKNNYTLLYDYMNNAGAVNPHYFFQDIFVANQVFSRGIKHIYDIGSRLDGYITHLLSIGIKVTMIDIRPLPIPIDGLEFVQGNAMSLDGMEDESISCLSSLHALEHFGLGRYGDPVDYEGWKKALHAIERKLKPGGLLFLSVPVGNRDLLMYNAHRIFRPATIYSQLKETLMLKSFTLVKDYTVTTTEFKYGSDVEEQLNDIARHLGEYDCGIFICQKI